MTAIAIGRSGGFFNRTPDSGHVATAGIDRLLKSAFDHYEGPITLDPRVRAFQTLREIFESRRQSGWDGYNALPITESAYLEACRFLTLLPDDLSIPEFSADPRGGITFEWYGGPNWVITVTVKGTGTIIYAGLMGEDNRAYGTQKFSDSISKVVLQNLRRVRP